MSLKIMPWEEEEEEEEEGGGRWEGGEEREMRGLLGVVIVGGCMRGSMGSMMGGGMGMGGSMGGNMGGSMEGRSMGGESMDLRGIMKGGEGGRGRGWLGGLMLFRSLRMIRQGESWRRKC